MNLDIKPLEYVDIKQGIIAVEQEIESLSKQLQISLKTLQWLKTELESYDIPTLKELKEEKQKHDDYCDQCGEEGHKEEEHAPIEEDIGSSKEQ
jgi:hypothetical protein